jgi:hypothetical protein
MASACFAKVRFWRQMRGRNLVLPTIPA